GLSKVQNMSKSTNEEQQLLRSVLEKSEGQKVLLVFTASWSGSSHILMQTIKQIGQSSPSIIHYTLDVDEYKVLANHFNVNNIPVIAVLKDRQLIDYIRKITSKKKLQARINAAIKNN
ncbi:MAG: thioredoxin family protein, partial [Bacteroidota bacterium]